MKIKKVAVLGMGLMALLAAPVMASPHTFGGAHFSDYLGEGEYEGEYEMEYDDGYVDGYIEGSIEGSYEYEGDYDGEEYRYRVMNRTNSTDNQSYAYAHEYRESYEYREGMYDEMDDMYEHKMEYNMPQGYGAVTVQVIYDGKPVKAVGYVVVDGIVKYIEDGAAFRVPAAGKLVVAAVGHPLVEVDLTQVEGSVRLDLATATVTPLTNVVKAKVEQMPSEPAARGQGSAQASVGGSAGQVQGQAQVNAQANQGAAVGATVQVKTEAQGEQNLAMIKTMLEKKLQAKVEGVKVKVEDGKVMYVATVKKPIRIGPIVLPFETTEEVEISAEALGEVE